MTEKFPLVEGGKYRELDSGATVTLLGLKQNQRLGIGFEDSSFKIISDADFFKLFEDLNIHDHETFCCTVHNLHASAGLHRGCILR